MPTYGPDGQECPNCKRLREALQTFANEDNWEECDNIGGTGEYALVWRGAGIPPVSHAEQALKTQPPQQDSKFWCDCHDERIWTDNCPNCQPSKPSCWDDCGAAGTPGAVPGDIGCDDCDMRNCQPSKEALFTETNKFTPRVNKPSKEGGE